MSTPATIIVPDGEIEYRHDDLDLAYIDGLAADLARILTAGDVAEAAYQPGDGTLYGIVIVPLSTLHAGQPRVYQGQVWQRHAVSGMKRPGGDDGGDGSAFYEDGGHLLCFSEKHCYPVWLAPGEERSLAAGYLAGHLDLPPASAVSVAILLRAICVHMGSPS